jgi:hypothetical protein
LVTWSSIVEKPWAMCEYTGGKAMFVEKSQNIYNLASLPITQVLSNSYIVEFRKKDKAVSERIIELFIRATNADGYKQFNVTY